MLFVLFLFISFFEIAFASCPDGSIASFSDAKKCYYFENQKLNWIAAEQSCKNLGGHLTSIHDMFENVFLEGEASTLFTDSTTDDFWIGANDILVPGNWTWSDGSPFDFNDFGKGQNASNCGALKLQGGTWIATDCMSLKSFACLVTVAASPTTTTTMPTPKSCPSSWTTYNSFCYKVFDNATWLDAEDRCKVDNAHLASIHTMDENLFLAHLAFYPQVKNCVWQTHTWIGLFTEDGQAHWNWTDNTAFDYSNWMPHGINPPNYNFNCGIMFLTPCTTSYYAETGNFDNVPCNTVMSKFICKKEAS